MKRTSWKELFKTIYHSKVTFLSIVIFIMMGMLLFLGIDYTSSCLVSNTSAYLNNTNTYDIQININPGWTNPNELLNIEGVDEVEATYSYIVPFKDGENGFEASFLSTPKRLNKLANIEGALPSNSGEVALNRFWAEDNNYKIGDTIKINNNPIYLNQGRFSVDEFKVTALVDSPLHMVKSTTVYGMSPTRNIPVNAVFFVDESSFNQTLNDYLGYSQISIKSNSLRAFDIFSDDYYQKVDDLVKKIKSSPALQDKTFTISTIRDSITHQNTQTITEVLGRNKYTMSALFFVVGLLVSYFSISRMVSETSTLIGIKKAKGYKNKEMYVFYLLYTGFAVLIGGILGTILGYSATQPIILNTIVNAMVMPKVNYYFGIIPVLILFAIELVSQLLITLISTHKVLNKRPIELLKGENAVIGKKRFYQKGKAWNKLSLFSKTLVNNLANDKTRVLSMLVGIVGCVSLLTCALTIDRNITNSFDYQFKNIFSFQAVVHYDGDIEDTKKELDKRNYHYDDVMFTYLTIDCPNGKKVSSQTYIFNDEQIDDFISMYDSKGKEIEFEDGIYLSFSYKEKFKLQDNSRITLSNASLKTIETETKAYFKHYLINNVAVMNSKTYFEKFGDEFKPNALVVDLDGRSITDLNNIVLPDSNVAYVYNIYSRSKVGFDSIASIFKVVDLVYLILALLMALLVILDLLVMFINEKKNELIILIINGYPKKTAKKYIYFDTIVLAIIGTALGVLLGTLMSNLVLKAFQNETIIFLTGFNLISILLSIIIATVIITSITLLALRKINKFKLNDINRIG